MHTEEQTQHFNNVLEKLAKDTSDILLSMNENEKAGFLKDVSTKQLRRIFTFSQTAEDYEVCNIIEDIINKRGYL